MTRQWRRCASVQSGQPQPPRLHGLSSGPFVSPPLYTAFQRFLRSSLPCSYPPMQQRAFSPSLYQGCAITNKMTPPLTSMTITHARMTRANDKLRCAVASSGSWSPTRRSRPGGSSRFAVKVFRPPVARSQEFPAKSTARRRASNAGCSVAGS